MIYRARRTCSAFGVASLPLPAQRESSSPTRRLPPIDGHGIISKDVKPFPAFGKVGNLAILLSLAYLIYKAYKN